MTFSREALEFFSYRAWDRAESDAALMHPPGRERERKARELMGRYYAEYVTLPAKRCECCGQVMPRKGEKDA